MNKKIDDLTLLGIFKVEAEERLQNMNKWLLELEKSSHNELAMKEFQREIHNLKGTSRMAGFNDIGTLAHKMEDVINAIQEGKLQINNVSEVLFNSLDVIGFLVEAGVGGQEVEVNTENILHNLNETLKHSQNLETKEIERANAKPLGKILIEDKIISQEQLQIALEKQKKGVFRELEETIRVSTSKLDSLSNTLGEMVIHQAKFEEYLNNLSVIINLIKEQNKNSTEITERLKTGSENLTNVFSDDLLQVLNKNKGSNARLLEKVSTIFNEQQDAVSTMVMITDKLQSDVMALRMLPISTVFDLFPRTVYDLAKEYNKKVDLKINGAETELDKKMLEQLKDPFMHLLRNAVDHGIESPDERKKIGKPEVGTISLSAWQEGGRIYIKVADDGRGIDPVKLKEIAVKKGLIDNDEAQRMSDDEARHLIFISGFSTSIIVTDVSGRGVGVDVVRRNIEDNLSGQIILSSEVHKGTEFTIILPLTLAVTPSVLIKSGGQLFAIPATSVQLCLMISPHEIQSVEGKEAIRVIDATVPLVRLDEVLGLPSGCKSSQKGCEGFESGDIIKVAVIEYGHQKIAFLVDELIKEQDIIIKPLEDFLQKVKNVAGITILEKGEVVPILHIPDLMDSAKQVTAGKKAEARVALPKEKETQRILIVEDSLTTRELEKNILKSAGFQVDTAVDGIDAFNKIAEEKPDLIVTDIQMPRMDGFKMTEKLKQDTKYKNIPVVMVTALVKDEEKRRGIEVGADAYITKTSFNQAYLIEIIERFIG